MQTPPSSKWNSFSEYLNQLASQSGRGKSELSDTQRFFNRELSWLAFNERVLSEAEDPSVPPLERLHFAIIVSSNLDEFFMVRVANLARSAKQNKHQPLAPDAPLRILAQIREQVLRQKERQARAFEDIIRDLSENGIHLFTDFSEYKELDREIVKRLPEVNFMIRRSSEPLPFLFGERLHCFVRFAGEYAVLSIPERSARLINFSNSTTQKYGLLERWLCARAPIFFPGREVLEAFPFKIIRDAELLYRTDDPDTFQEQIVQAVDLRSKAKVVRLEVDAPAYSEGVMTLASMLGITSAALYRFNLPLDLRSLTEIYKANRESKLAYPPVHPVVPKKIKTTGDVFDTVKKQDLLLHHPYDSFDVIVRFLQEAAKDPRVTQIVHTLYRTSRESPIMESLVKAAESGKKVTVYVEVKARFDELNNVQWAERLKKAGAKVIRPMKDFKVHCKLTQVLRKANEEETYFTHLGTGNYHPGTARQYTDIGLLTCDPVIGKEVAAYFDWLSAQKGRPEFHEILVAPQYLGQEFIQLIEEEIAQQKSGGKGRILAKMNSLVDEEIIEALYRASNAGVKVELVVRGICRLRPGVKDMSENIRVTSVVDRFLEHSRIYYFRAGGQKKVYLSSADWMPRNFNSRYEIAFPVKDPALKAYVLEGILYTSRHDNVKAWTLLPDGTYQRVKRSGDAKPLRSQWVFADLALRDYRGTVLHDR